ncbi:hypothetical protein [Klebsiella oxytoca]|uniref:hypothetical protein n=1 Tax=Klebsiella oxytoca TaxID=571 RepID=UPI00190EC12C|nr:hypothetical protein [Klebsiella oxytoca]
MKRIFSLLAISVLLSGCIPDPPGQEPSEPEIKTAMTDALQQKNRKLLDALAEDESSGKDAEGIATGMLRPHTSALYSLEKMNCIAGKTNDIFICEVDVDMDAGFGRVKQVASLILINKDSGWTVLI